MKIKKKVFAIMILIVMVPVACFAASNTFEGFEAEDYNGQKVTADIFRDYEVTMVNIFTTWCGYCIREMPDIEKLYKDLPEGSNIVAICADAYDAPDDLKDIVDHLGLDFTIIKMDIEDLLEIYGVLGYPTTVFVDRTGKTIASVSGAKTYAMYKNAIVSLLNRK